MKFLSGTDPICTEWSFRAIATVAVHLIAIFHMERVSWIKMYS